MATVATASGDVQAAPLAGRFFFVRRMDGRVRKKSLRRTRLPAAVGG